MANFSKKGVRQGIIYLMAFILPIWLGGCGSEGRTIAVVNGQKVTVKDFRDELARAPAQMRPVYEQEPQEVLDRLIATVLLLQEARRRGFLESSELRDMESTKTQEGMRRLMLEEIKGVEGVTEREVQAFYRRYRDELGGKPLSEMRGVIRMMLLEQKREEKIGVLVQRLRREAAITTYPERLPKPQPPAIEASTGEAFKAALASGRPTLVDFGSNRCIPCIQLRPVLADLKKAHGDRLNVLFLEVSDHRDLARHYKVQLVPTLIFFDKRGREVHRNMGYMDRTAIERTLRELGFLEG